MNDNKHRQIFFSAVDSISNEYIMKDRPISFAQACDLVLCSNINSAGTKYFNQHNFSIDKESNTLIGAFSVHPAVPAENKSKEEFLKEFLEHFN